MWTLLSNRKVYYSHIATSWCARLSSEELRLIGLTPWGTEKSTSSAPVRDVRYAQPPIRGTLNEGVQHERECKEGTTIQCAGLPPREETHGLRRGYPRFVTHLLSS